MKIRLRRFMRQWRKNEAGVAYIELALSIMVLTVMLFGLIEITSFMQVKNKMNQVADQMASVLSTLPNWQPDIYVTPVLDASGMISSPFGVYMSAAYCSGGTGTRIENTYDSLAERADCSYGTGGGGTGALKIAACDDGRTQTNTSLYENSPTTQYVVVSASCRYKPYLNYFGLFGKMVITSTTVTPMRYHMQW